MRCPSQTRNPPLARTKRHNRRIASLVRGGPRRKPKRRFVLVCEGRKTEPCYFRALEKAFASTLVTLEIVEGVGVPLTVATRAAEAQDLYSDARRSRDSFAVADQVWAVFDVDEHPRFTEAVSLCEEHHVRVGRSNPCFELWLILHERDYDKCSTCKTLQKELETVRPEYNRKRSKTPNCDELVAHVDDAEARAVVQLDRREQSGDPYGNPSTTVGLLVQTIREADEGARR